MSFFVLFAAAFGFVAAVTSLALGGTTIACTRLMRSLAPAARARVLFTVSLAPVTLAAVTVVVACAPSLFGFPDHCTVHEGHPHLCAAHASFDARSLMPLVTALVLLRLSSTAVRAMESVRRRWRAFASLHAVATWTSRNIAIIDLREPFAFAAGLFRQRIYVSRGLIEDQNADPMLDVVLAHERAHVRRHDALRSAMAGFALAFHLPWIARSLYQKLADAHEAAADAEAARETGSPARVANAIVRIARAQAAHAVATGGASFEGGGLEARVSELLAERSPRNAPGAIAIALIAVCVVVAMMAGHDAVHHGLESALGLFGG